MTYCKRCKSRTNSEFNDYFVEFCAECKSVKGYHREPAPFTCIACGQNAEETYAGQKVCNECLRGIPF